MRAFRIRLVASVHRAAGPRTAHLADTGQITEGCSTELADYLMTARLNHGHRTDVAALWAHVETVGCDQARTLRQLDDEQRAAARERHLRALAVEREWRTSA